MRVNVAPNSVSSVGTLMPSMGWLREMPYSFFAAHV